MFILQVLKALYGPRRVPRSKLYKNNVSPMAIVL